MINREVDSLHKMLSNICRTEPVSHSNGNGYMASVEVMVVILKNVG